MATTLGDNQQETMAARLRAVGVDLPELDLFHERELRRSKLLADTSRTSEYRQTEFARIDEEVDQRLWAARDREIADKRRPLEQRRGQIMAEITGQTSRDGSIETSDAQRERLGRATQEALSLNADLLAIQTMRDPVELRNLFDEAEMSGRVERLRKLGPVVVAQLERLERSKVRAAAEAAMAVRIGYQTFKQQNPPAIERLRRVDEELAGVEPLVSQRYARAREHFKVGRR